MGSGTLPDIDQTAAAFDAAFTDYYVSAKNNYDLTGNTPIGALPTSEIVKRVTAEWGNQTDDVLRRFQRRMSGYVRSVYEDGAVGDGVTDDTAAIQATIDAVEAKGGGVVFFPEGTYETSATLTYNSLLTFRGVGPKGSIVNFDGTGYAFDSSNPSQARDGTSWEAMGVAYSATADGGIYLRDAGDCMLIYVEVSSVSPSSGDCFRIEGPTVSGANRISVLGCYANLGANGFRFGGGAGSVILSDCHIDQCTDGVEVTGANGVRIANCDILNGTNAIFIDATVSGECDGLVIMGNRFLGNTTNINVNNASRSNLRGAIVMGNHHEDGILYSDLLDSTRPAVIADGTPSATTTSSLTTDLTLDGDLDMSGIHTLTMGDATTGGVAGIVWNKLGASDLTYSEYRIGGVSQLTWDKRFTSGEDLEWRHYDNAGALTGVAMRLAYDATDFSNTELQVQNLEVAVDADFASANPNVTIGNAGGSPDLFLNKADAGTSRIIYFNLGVQSWAVKNDASEDFKITRAGDLDTFDLLQSSGLAHFYADVQIDGDVTRANGGLTTWGDGTETGTVQTGHQYQKADAGALITERYTIGSSVRWEWKFESNEGLTINHYDNTGSFQGGAWALRYDTASREKVEVRRTRDAMDLGTSLVTGDFSLSAGWGTTATVDTASGSDSAGYIEVTANGASIAADPTITFTFTDGAWSSAPLVMLQRNDAQSPTPASAYLTYTSGTTSITITFNGTPVGGNTYIIEFRCCVI